MAHIKGYLKIKYLVRSDSIPNFLIFRLFDNYFLDKNKNCFCITFMMEAIYIYREVLQHFL